MTQVETNEDGFVVDATLLAEAFNLEVTTVQALMRNGEITSLSEAGIDEDLGRARLTFHYRDRVVRFVVDQAGNILKRASFPATSRTPKDQQ
ncbi:MULTISPECIES: DUF6522 family protein [Falsihalocynthiibacter]|uniref:DUF6522 family protein n=1 Tax=Falsihalocynthiibacter TaxID=2854182 RepID=UPI0030024F07